MTRIEAYCLALVFCMAAAAAAAEPAGMIKISRGDAGIERAGQSLPAAVGAEVFASDTLRTGHDGALGVTMHDETLLSLGPNSVLSLDHFEFDTTSHAGGMTSTLKRGSLVVNTGKLAKTVPDSVEFRTPTTILGVRGTRFAMEVDGPGD
jgi:hypothetical protein